MLDVVSLEEARAAVLTRFAGWMDAQAVKTETVPVERAAVRRIAKDVVAEEGVPPFNRSMVDGYAVVAADTFGCSEALPALLTLAGEVTMGEAPAVACAAGTCVRIPTGGELPAGADAVAMLEYCEDFGDGTIGVAKPCAPGENVVFANDDVAPGDVLIPAGTRLLPHHIGTLASLGVVNVELTARPRVGIISTGDEIVPVDTTPEGAQMRDVNEPMLAATVAACGAVPVTYGIVPDDAEALQGCLGVAMATCDMVLISGGSSAGTKDNTSRVLEEVSELLFHGVAVKPGKPTMVADANGTPVFGLPGHPVAAYFMFLELVRPLLLGRSGDADSVHVAAKLAVSIPSNHGRAEFVGVRLEEREGGAVAVPIRGKSGLISQLTGADGYLIIPRNCEGLAAGEPVDVRLFAR